MVQTHLPEPVVAMTSDAGDHASCVGVDQHGPATEPKVITACATYAPTPEGLQLGLGVGNFTVVSVHQRPRDGDHVFGSPAQPESSNGVHNLIGVGDHRRWVRCDLAQPTEHPDDLAAASASPRANALSSVSSPSALTDSTPGRLDDRRGRPLRE